MSEARSEFHVVQQFQPLVREIGLDAEAVFERPDIVPWRSLRERQNCTLDAELADGRTVRLHVKRHFPAGTKGNPAADEVCGIRLLRDAGIATTPLVAWGTVSTGASFLITLDLASYAAADKLVDRGVPFETLLTPTADLAAKLHDAELHHRDLYLCHFFGKTEGEAVADLRLIDAGRVKRLPIWPLRRRWVVKDLAQFWYSTRNQSITDEQRHRWLGRYAERRKISSVESLRGAIERKSAWIAKHDEKLRRKQPGRDVSIPEGGA